MMSKDPARLLVLYEVVDDIIKNTKNVIPDILREAYEAVTRDYNTWFKFEKLVDKNTYYDILTNDSKIYFNCILIGDKFYSYDDFCNIQTIELANINMLRFYNANR